MGQGKVNRESGSHQIQPWVLTNPSPSPCQARTRTLAHNQENYIHVSTLNLLRKGKILDNLRLHVATTRCRRSKTSEAFSATSRVPFHCPAGKLSLLMTPTMTALPREWEHSFIANCPVTPSKAQHNCLARPSASPCGYLLRCYAGKKPSQA